MDHAQLKVDFMREWLWKGDESGSKLRSCHIAVLHSEYHISASVWVQGFLTSIATDTVVVVSA